MDIYLMRHGETRANRDNIIQGDSNAPWAQLTAAGRAQAASARERLAALAPTQIFCSPLDRTQETLQLAVGNVPVTFDTRMREINYGCFQGRTQTWVKMLYPEWWHEAAGNVRAGYESFAGGESFTAVTQRAMAFLRSIPEQPGPVLVVTHGYVIRSAVAGILGVPETGTLREPPNVSLTKISRDCDNFAVWYYGR
ncbi:histidine phosphatase family protein [Schleiferilactobacillus shenzhenensis]|uniref:Phosphoglycerate mutase n=1 Tax=Schleiferilactobacillus shenzhenensis LY-73 TaxID=1231336 RepID=U4TJ49_9LACO|nr:histidine phosphatase family protein [Schleiferilactobacillus shenzhenensis]ERL64239.1 hypothetical protein L248_1422 [Schleiferilactobacillus shenzhenensis LY-73]